jgi:hypothetical protein
MSEHNKQPAQRSATKERFSKQRLVDDLLAKCQELEAEYGFQEGWGWSRVIGKETDVIVNFGRYQAWLDLIEEYGQ